MNGPSKIDSFSGEWDFLSNFYPCVITFEGMHFASVEHAYQAAKTVDLRKREVFTFDLNPRLHAGQAKRIGRNLKPLRPDWDEVKVGIMRELLVQKFSQPAPRSKLLSTCSAELVEGNWWHDLHWGVCLAEQNGHTCRYGIHEPVGDNHLGRLLMEIRSLIVSTPLPPVEYEPCGSSGSTLADLRALRPE